MTEWAQRPDVNKSYSELAEKHGLVEKELRDTDRIFGLLVSHLIGPACDLTTTSELTPVQDVMINRVATVNFR